MSFSLNEIEATAKRAARGAGYSWGQAEEAAKAARWLCAQGMDGIGALARLLELGLASDPASHRPQQANGLWQADSHLCPISAGTFLSDRALLLDAGRAEMQEVVAPALLLPFVSNAARVRKCTLKIEIDAIRAMTDGFRLSALDRFPSMAKRVSISEDVVCDAPRKICTRTYPAQCDLDVLNDFAHRTYAPATEESRLRGAGAGLSDND